MEQAMFNNGMQMSNNPQINIPQLQSNGYGNEIL